MKKILVPTDFSEPATWAVTAAKDIASRSGAEIILLHVVEQQRKESFNAQGQIEMIEDWEERIFTSKLIQRGKNQLAEIANAAGSSAEAQELLERAIQIEARVDSSHDFSLNYMQEQLAKWKNASAGRGASP